MTIIQKNINLSIYSTWRVGGCADFFAQPCNIEELKHIENKAKDHKWPITILAGGTNCLISDRGVRGLVISLRKLTKLSSFKEDGFLKIECLAGTSKLLLMKEFLKHKLAPAIFLSGIPGTVSGGVVMNAGISEKISPRDFSEIVDWVEVVHNQKLLRKKASQIKWSYRNSERWGPGIIARVGFRWPLKPQVRNLSQRVQRARQQRIAKQPLKDHSCGSTFVNPQDSNLTAGQWIEKSEMKGFQIGQAQVSEKHANFIVNLGGAKAIDIHYVINDVQNIVYDKMGVQLKTEVKYLGEW